MPTPRGINAYAAGFAIVQDLPGRLLPDFSHTEPLKASLAGAGIIAKLQDDSGAVWILDPNGRKETLCVVYLDRDQEYNIDGASGKDLVIVLRYLPSPDGKDWVWWNDSRLFYPSFDALSADIAAGNYEAGVRASFLTKS